MFVMGKRKKVLDYLKNEILRYSLGCQDLLKKWLRADLQEDGALLPEKLTIELNKYYSAVNATLTVGIRKDFSDDAADKLAHLLDDYQKDQIATAGQLLLFAYSAIMNEMPNKRIEEI